MPGFANIMLMGTIARTPELRFTPKGAPVCTVDMHVVRTWTGSTGAVKTEHVFIGVSMWGAAAERLKETCVLGDLIYVDGRLTMDEWVGKTDGVTRRKHCVEAENFEKMMGVQDKETKT